MNEDGVLRGDDDLTAAPTTRLLIDGMDPIGE
jgi:hypothetical protein